MDAKTYLRQLERHERRIEALYERREFYRALSERGTSTYTALRVSGTDQHSKVEDCAIKLIDIRDEIEQEIAHLEERERIGCEAIDKVGDSRFRDILAWRYINHWSWERIMEGLGCGDMRWTFRLHGRALQAIAPYLPLGE